VLTLGLSGTTQPMPAITRPTLDVTDPTGNYANANGLVDDVIGQPPRDHVTPYSVTYNA